MNLLDQWSGPFGGVPPFDAVTVTTLGSALRGAMDLRRGEVRRIAESPEPPTFANTILALEQGGRAFARVASMFETFTATMSDKPMQALEQEMAPELAAFSDELTQNTALFARIKALHDAPLELAPDERRLLDTIYRAFARRGAALDDTAKARLGAINQRLATLFTTFGQNVLADEESQYVELPDGTRVANTRSAVEPFLTNDPRRELRERVWKMFVSRGETTNIPVIREILALRRERARLLGFASHAHWILDDNMAKTPGAAMDLMMKVWRAAAARAREEIADMEKLAGGPIEAWDYRYYAEQVRKAKYDLDQSVITPYLELSSMRDAMFWVAARVYGLSFEKLDGVPVYHPDVTAYVVRRAGDEAAGDPVGLWYFDPYARDGKRSGAWMSEYRTQERFADRILPIVSNNANFTKGKPGEPVLISWDDATTMFHEFGHALHGLLSNVRFPTLAGTNTLRDFVELPSQLHEHWLATPEVLSRFALHHETRQPIPSELVEKLRRAKTFNQGFKTVEYLSAAIYDMKIHTQPGEIDPNAFEREVMTEIGMPREIVMRHRPTQFAHIFTSDGYSAGYYSYLWADTLTADVGEAFQAAGSYFDAVTAKQLHDHIMSVGNSVPPEVAFRAFRGRDVDTDALMRDRGFAS